MSNVNTGSSIDQAEGLRNIFGAELCQIICLASTLDPDSTIHLGNGAAHSIKHQGHKVLLVDEVPLSLRKTMSGFLYPTRYDLGQTFSGSVDLPKCLSQIEDSFWYSTSVKLRPEINSRFAKHPPLDERLIGHGLDIDYVIFPTTVPLASVLSYFGKRIKNILVTSSERESLKKALTMIRQMTLMQSSEPLSVLIVGGDNENAGTLAFDELNSASQKAFEQSLDFLGWIDAVVAQRVELDRDDLNWYPVNEGQKHEFVLPNGFFKAISAKITS
jgi:hypothetical protein